MITESFCLYSVQAIGESVDMPSLTIVVEGNCIVLAADEGAAIAEVEEKEEGAGGVDDDDDDQIRIDTCA